MPGKTTTLANKFRRRLINLESTRQKMESLFSLSYLSLHDIEHVYSGLFLDTFTEFESLIEQLFIGLLSGSLYSPSNTIMRKVRITPCEKTKEILLGGRSYLNWLPYEKNTLERAKLYFDDAVPFSVLDETETQNLQDYHVIRNSLAHKSEKSMNQFQKLIAGLPLLQHEKIPSSYLRSQPHSSSAQTQFEICSFQLDSIAQKICS